MGPPKGANKSVGAVRETLLAKLEPRLDMYARRLRDLYHREGMYSDDKMFLEPLRMRQPSDTLQKALREKFVPGVIKAREEHDDVDLVWAWQIPHRITRVDHGKVRPWYVVHPETEEEIRVTVSNIDYHDKTQAPFYMELQRYIVGRPNLLCLNVQAVQEDKSPHFNAGCEFS